MSHIMASSNVPCGRPLPRRNLRARLILSEHAQKTNVAPHQLLMYAFALGWTSVHDSCSVRDIFSTATDVPIQIWIDDGNLCYLRRMTYERDCPNHDSAMRVVSNIYVTLFVSDDLQTSSIIRPFGPYHLNPENRPVSIQLLKDDVQYEVKRKEMGTSWKQWYDEWLIGTRNNTHFNYQQFRCMLLGLKDDVTRAWQDYDMLKYLQPGHRSLLSYMIEENQFDYSALSNFNEAHIPLQLNHLFRHPESDKARTSILNDDQDKLTKRPQDLQNMLTIAKSNHSSDAQQLQQHLHYAARENAHQHVMHRRLNKQWRTCLDLALDQYPDDVVLHAWIVHHSGRHAFDLVSEAIQTLHHFSDQSKLEECVDHLLACEGLSLEPSKLKECCRDLGLSTIIEGKRRTVDLISQLI